MVELIDKGFGFLIRKAPNWRTTSRLMAIRYRWFSYWRQWCDDCKQWERKLNQGAKHNANRSTGR